MIPFNKPCIVGKELNYISESLRSGKISGDGLFTKKVHSFFETKYSFKKCLLTSSCTDALEMCALLLNIKDGDEVIMPAYTFVSTANAFVLRGAKVVFVDSMVTNPNMDTTLVEAAITPKTKAIVVVHYAGVVCDMDKIIDITKRYNLYIIEDAAQAIDSFYISQGKKRPAGSLGHLSTFSFHETKNVICGEGGMLVINDEQFIKRAEIIREKGTNRSSFFRGEIDKYGWVDIGSSFLPSDILAAFLFGQLEMLDVIQNKRKQLWNKYYENFSLFVKQNYFKLPIIPDYACHNYHIFYLIFNNIEQRQAIIKLLHERGFMAVFHYQSLNKSLFYNENSSSMNNSDMFSDCLLRLPLYHELTLGIVDEISKCIINAYVEK